MHIAPLSRHESQRGDKATQYVPKGRSNSPRGKCDEQSKHGHSSAPPDRQHPSIMIPSFESKTHALIPSSEKKE